MRARKNIADATWHHDDSDDSDDEYEVESIEKGDCITAVWPADVVGLKYVHLGDIFDFADLRAQPANYYRATVNAITGDGE